MKNICMEWNKEINRKDGRNFKLSYLLLEEINKDSIQYGIEIQKEQSLLKETEYTGPISYSKEVVRKMITCLVNNSVTPMTLLEVMDDMITERLCS